MILTVTLQPVFSRDYLISGFKPTARRNPQRLAAMAAGGGINISRLLQKLQVPSLATGILGGQVGKLIEGSLDQEGLRHDFVKIRASAAHSILIVDPEEGLHLEITEKGPPIPQGAWQRLQRKLQGWAPQSSWLVLAGQPGEGTPHSAFARLIDACGPFAIKTALRIPCPWLRETIASKPHLLHANWQGFQQLVGPCYSTMQALEKGAMLIEQGVGTLLLAMGKQGALALNGTTAFFGQESAPLKNISPLGSDDALLAGFLAQLQRGQSLPEALRFGLAAAASNRAHWARGFLDLKQVESLAANIGVQQIPIQR